MIQGEPIRGINLKISIVIRGMGWNRMQEDENRKLKTLKKQKKRMD